jgi:hypothetical protein
MPTIAAIFFTVVKLLLSSTKSVFTFITFLCSCFQKICAGLSVLLRITHSDVHYATTSDSIQNTRVRLILRLIKQKHSTRVLTHNTHLFMLAR